MGNKTPETVEEHIVRLTTKFGFGQHMAKEIRAYLLQTVVPIIEKEARGMIPDTARLDWLDTHDKLEALHFHMVSGAEIGGRPMTVREAIDDLRKADV